MFFWFNNKYPNLFIPLQFSDSQFLCLSKSKFVHTPLFPPLNFDFVPNHVSPMRLRPPPGPRLPVPEPTDKKIAGRPESEKYPGNLFTFGPAGRPE